MNLLLPSSVMYISLSFALPFFRYWSFFCHLLHPLCVHCHPSFYGVKWLTLLDILTAHPPLSPSTHFALFSSFSCSSFPSHGSTLASFSLARLSNLRRPSPFLYLMTVAVFYYSVALYPPRTSLPPSVISPPLTYSCPLVCLILSSLSNPHFPHLVPLSPPFP